MPRLKEDRDSTNRTSIAPSRLAAAVVVFSRGHPLSGRVLISSNSSKGMEDHPGTSSCRPSSIIRLLSTSTNSSSTNSNNSSSRESPLSRSTSTMAPLSWACSSVGLLSWPVRNTWNKTSTDGSTAQPSSLTSTSATHMWLISSSCSSSPGAISSGLVY